MTHIDDGVLRRLVDESAAGFALDPAEAAHLAGCSACQTRLAATRHTAQMVARLFADPVPMTDWKPALARLRQREADAPTHVGGLERIYLVTAQPPVRRWLKPLSLVAAIALLVALLVLTPLGSYAQGVLNLFTPRQFVAVPVTEAQLRTVPDLSDFGAMTRQPAPSPRVVNSADEAAAAAGMTLLKPASLPGGVSNQVTYQVMPGSSVTYTFDAAKAAAAAQAKGKTITAMPDRINGATLKVTMYPAAMTQYGESQISLPEGNKGAGQKRSVPTLMIAQAKAPVAESTGATLAEIQAYILSQPGIAPELAAAVRGIADPTSTLPVPVDISQMNARDVQVQGANGLLMGDATGLGAVVIWQKDGFVYFVGGPLKDSEVLAVANTLR